MESLDASQAVLLCERPAGLGGGLPTRTTAAMVPFVPSSGNTDRWGLTPVRQVHIRHLEARKVTALDRHRHFLHRLLKSVEGQQQRQQQALVDEHSRKQRLASFCQQLRNHVLHGAGTLPRTWTSSRAAAASQVQGCGAAAHGKGPPGADAAPTTGAAASVATRLPTAGMGGTAPAAIPTAMQAAAPAVAVEPGLATQLGGVADVASSSGGGGGRGPNGRDDPPGLAQGLEGDELRSAAFAAMRTFVDSAFGEAQQLWQDYKPKGGDAAQAGGAPNGKSADQCVNADGQEGVSGTGKAAGKQASGPRPDRSHKKKPAWALTDQEAAALAAGEEDELLHFTAGLDYDAFVDRLDGLQLQELRQELQDINDDMGKDQNAAGSDPLSDSSEGGGGGEARWRRRFVRALNQATMRQVQLHSMLGHSKSADDGCSVAAASDAAHSTYSRETVSTRAKAAASAERRADLAARDKDSGWDGSSLAADDVAQLHALATKSQQADEVLRDNPEMRSVHSVSSVRQMLERCTAAAGTDGGGGGNGSSCRAGGNQVVAA